MVLHRSFTKHCMIVAIVERRAQTIDTFLEYTFAYQGFGSRSDPGKALCRDRSRSDGCDAMLLGSLTRGLQTLGACPTKPQYKTFKLLSAEEMVEKIMGIKLCYSVDQVARDEPCKPRPRCPTLFREHGEISNCPPRNHSHRGCMQALTSRLQSNLERVVSRCEGLQLSQFESPKSRLRGFSGGKWQTLEYS